MSLVVLCHSALAALILDFGVYIVCHQCTFTGNDALDDLELFSMLVAFKLITGFRQQVFLHFLKKHLHILN